MTALAFAVGDRVEPFIAHLTRDSLVRYAGASLDFNPIHYRDDVAKAAGLPGVLAQGMLTMGIAIQAVVAAVGDPGRVIDYQVRFTRPVVVDPQTGADISVDAEVKAVDAEADTTTFALTVTFEGKTVLGKAIAVVRGTERASVATL